MSENILVHTPAIPDNEKQPNYIEVLTASPPEQSNLLIVSYTRSPDQWMQTWTRTVETRPAEFGFIRVGDTMRSATQAPTQSQQSHPPIEAIANPSNLTEVGIRISERLNNWHHNDQQTVICFDSITALLQYAENLQTAYRFLHTLVGRVQTAEARACYLVTPDAHDDQTLATVSTLFDDIVE